MSGKGISLKYDDADLYDFIDVVASVLDLNYIIEPAVSGRVNINMNKPVPKEALFPIFIDILRINGATIVKSGEIYHIVPITEGKKYPGDIEKIDSTARSKAASSPPTSSLPNSCHPASCRRSWTSSRPTKPRSSTTKPTTS